MPSKNKQSPADLPLVPEDVEAYSIAETARLFGISPQQVRRLIGEGRLEGVGHRPTKTGLAYFVPRAAMEARGYAAKAQTASEAEEALKAQVEALKASEAALRAEAERLKAEKEKAEEAATSARSTVEFLRGELSKAEFVAIAKGRESYLLEQALLRLPLALGSGKPTLWSRLRRKEPTEAEKREALNRLKGEDGQTNG